RHQTLFSTPPHLCHRASVAHLPSCVTLGKSWQFSQNVIRKDGNESKVRYTLLGRNTLVCIRPRGLGVVKVVIHSRLREGKCRSLARKRGEREDLRIEEGIVIPGGHDGLRNAIVVLRAPALAPPTLLKKPRPHTDQIGF